MDDGTFVPVRGAGDPPSVTIMSDSRGSGTTIVIGGVAGGMSAATRLRRLDPHAHILVVERSGHVSYANCGLPYYAGGVITGRDELLLQTPESLNDRFDLDVHVHTEAVDIDAAAKTVTLRDTRTGDERHASYDQLILSPGAAPFRPPIPGIEHARTLRNVEDVDVIASAASTARRAVIVGAGFIGLELAENLRHRGIEVIVLELADQVLAPLDPELAGLVQDELERGGVDVRLEVSAASIEPDGSGDHALVVALTDGSELPCDLVVMSIGVRPSTKLAELAGAEIGPLGGIVVDDELRTSVPDIFAVGDATEKRDTVLGDATLVPLANVANRHGRRAADVIAGVARPAGSTQGTAIVRVFDLIVAATGANEKRLRAAGHPYVAVHLHPSSHAGYYPGAQQMAIKALIDPDSHRLLGAQIVGGEGVDKRIDVLATALHVGLPAPELADLELAYAPPFGSAKDPINLLGYIAENRLSGAERALQWHELTPAVLAEHQVVDVRSPAEYRSGHLPDAQNLPVDALRERLDELDPEQPVLVYCAVGQRAHTALALLDGLGYDVWTLDGGIRTWQAVHAPVTDD